MFSFLWVCPIGLRLDVSDAGEASDPWLAANPVHLFGQRVVLNKFALGQKLEVRSWFSTTIGLFTWEQHLVVEGCHAFG